MNPWHPATGEITSHRSLRLRRRGGLHPAKRLTSKLVKGLKWGTQYSEDAEEIVMPRPRRRMNIDQLRTAFEQVSGGISWTERSGRNEVNLFETLSSTLGKPDFAQTTDEELEPTILFQKFLGDAARSVCFKMLDADRMAMRQWRMESRRTGRPHCLFTSRQMKPQRSLKRR